jgi:membrane fusion protein (multidrug efflux system)
MIDMMKKNNFKVSHLIGILILVLGIIAVASIFFKGDYEETDDAQIDQYVSPINVRVTGYVKDIRFTDHQWVKRGDTLLVIDDNEFRINLMQAEAALLEAEGGKKVANISVKTSSDNAGALDAQIEEEQLHAANLQKDYLRFKALLEKKAATPMVVEQYKTNLEMSLSSIEAMKKRKKAAESEVNEVDQRSRNSEASILRAKAAIALAKLNLSYTVVTAPCSGYIGKRNLEIGQLVNAGMAITTLMPSSKKWITANFKETQLNRIWVGQKVIIEIDAFPNRKFEGEVKAISSATGSKYSLMPTDNAVGNFVKIQQRVPVKISINNASANENNRMAAGMMCNVRVKVDGNK